MTRNRLKKLQQKMDDMNRKIQALEKALLMTVGETMNEKVTVLENDAKRERDEQFIDRIEDIWSDVGDLYFYITCKDIPITTKTLTLLEHEIERLLDFVKHEVVMSKVGSSEDKEED